MNLILGSLCIFLGGLNLFYFVKPYKTRVKLERFQKFFGNAAGTLLYIALYIVFPIVIGLIAISPISQ